MRALFEHFVPPPACNFMHIKFSCSLSLTPTQYNRVFVSCFLFQVSNLYATETCYVCVCATLPFTEMHPWVYRTNLIICNNLIEKVCIFLRLIIFQLPGANRHARAGAHHNFPRATLIWTNETLLKAHLPSFILIWSSLQSLMQLFSLHIRIGSASISNSEWKNWIND